MFARIEMDCQEKHAPWGLRKPEEHMLKQTVRARTRVMTVSN
jgi:hypothetical protein